MNKIKNLKNEIISIVKDCSMSEAERLSLCFSLFIDFSLLASLETMRANKKNISNKEIFSDYLTSMKKEFLDVNALFNSSLLYFDLVKENVPFEDILTELYEELVLTNKHGNGLAQFFTPQDYSNLMAELYSQDLATEATLRTPMRLGDPCAGSASLVIAPLKHVYDCKPEALAYINVFINDIDTKALKAACLQIFANMTTHRIEIYSVEAFHANIITQYKTPGYLFLDYQSKLKSINEVFSIDNIL